MQEGIGREHARYREWNGRRQKERREGRQVGTERGDRARGHAKRDQKRQQFDVEAASNREPHGRPAKTDPHGEIDCGEAETPPDAPSIARGSRPSIKVSKRQVGERAGDHVANPRRADPGLRQSQGDEPRRQDRRRRGCRDGGHRNEVEQGLDLRDPQATPHVLGRHRHVALDPYADIASFGASMPPRCECASGGAIAPPRARRLRFSLRPYRRQAKTGAIYAQRIRQTLGWGSVGKLEVIRFDRRRSTTRASSISRAEIEAKRA